MKAVPDPSRSRAVLVGAGRYQVLGQLPAVHNNLTALAEALRDERVWGLPYGNCFVVEDPVSATEALDPITEAAQEATDTLLVYYAGHGLIDPRRGELHLAHVGSDPRRMYTAIQYSQVRDLLLDSRAVCRLVILDCCYSGRALGQMGNAAETIATEASAEGTYVLAAAAENKAAIAPPGERFTAFTGELLHIIERGISGQGPLLELDSIYRELLAVMRAKGLPNPQKRDRNTAGHLALIRNQAYRPAVVKRARCWHHRCVHAEPADPCRLHRAGRGARGGHGRDSSKAEKRRLTVVRVRSPESDPIGFFFGHRQAPRDMMAAS